MESILLAQAQQDAPMCAIVLKYGTNQQLLETSMSDAYWPSVMPQIWADVYAALGKRQEPKIVQLFASRLGASEARRMKGAGFSEAAGGSMKPALLAAAPFPHRPDAWKGGQGTDFENGWHRLLTWKLMEVYFHAGAFLYQ